MSARDALELVVRASEEEALIRQLDGADLRPTAVPTIAAVVPAHTARTSRPDGPLQTTAQVGADDDLVAEVLVFVEDGRLSRVELLWYADGEPAWPDAGRLVLRRGSHDGAGLTPLPELVDAIDRAEAEGRLVLGLEGFRRAEGGVRPDLAFVADLGDHGLTVAGAAAEARAIAARWQGPDGPDLVEIVV